MVHAATKALADCKRRWPNVDKNHPDYATTKITKDLLMVLQGTPLRKFEKSTQKGLERDRDNTKGSWSGRKRERAECKSLSRSM